MWDGRASVINNDPNNVQLNFDAASNSISVTILNTYVETHLAFRYKKKHVFSISGRVDAHGPIKSITMRATFDSQPKDGTIVPKINVDNIGLNLDRGAFKIDVHAHHIPHDITKGIVSLVKNEVLKKVEKEIVSQLSSKVTPGINAALLASFPTAVELTPGMSMSTGFTGPITISPEYISLPLDGTVFETS